ncbi:hypothetical protein HYX02_00260 [Candidatus Woesearchaeota archaeon]|nr:hypothetical protein [Candidatus Woesearchaeota archaeon]
MQRVLRLEEAVVVLFNRMHGTEIWDLMLDEVERFNERRVLEGPLPLYILGTQLLKSIYKLSIPLEIPKSDYQALAELTDPLGFHIIGVAGKEVYLQFLEAIGETAQGIYQSTRSMQITMAEQLAARTLTTHPLAPVVNLQQYRQKRANQ